MSTNSATRDEQLFEKLTQVFEQIGAGVPEAEACREVGVPVEVIRRLRGLLASQPEKMAPEDYRKWIREHIAGEIVKRFRSWFAVIGVAGIAALFGLAQVSIREQVGDKVDKTMPDQLAIFFAKQPQVIADVNKAVSESIAKKAADIDKQVKDAIDSNLGKAVYDAINQN